jgi:hypothetical protein
VVQVLQIKVTQVGQVILEMLLLGLQAVVVEQVQLVLMELLVEQATAVTEFKLLH